MNSAMQHWKRRHEVGVERLAVATAPGYGTLRIGGLLFDFEWAGASPLRSAARRTDKTCFAVSTKRWAAGERTKSARLTRETCLMIAGRAKATAVRVGNCASGSICAGKMLIPAPSAVNASAVVMRETSSFGFS